MKIKTLSCTAALSIAAIMAAQPVQAAISLDRTRVIFDGTRTSTSLTIANQNKTLPYLAQAWVEDAQGNKIENPLTALPPLQRVEPGTKSQIKLQVTGGTTPLAQDKESLYYFNLREIPPKSDKPNTLQIALQTRVKLFYRPASLALESGAVPQKALTMTRSGDRYKVNNPTGYYVTIVHAAASEKGADVPGFKADMVAPKGSLTLGGSASALGSHPVLTFINDYGGRPQLFFSCSGATCTVNGTKAG